LLKAVLDTNHELRHNFSIALFYFNHTERRIRIASYLVTGEYVEPGRVLRPQQLITDDPGLR